MLEISAKGHISLWILRLHFCPSSNF